MQAVTETRCAKDCDTQLLFPRSPVLIRRSVGFVASCVLLLIAICSRSVAQTQPYSSTAEYKSLLRQLHESSVHPSAMGAGTLLTEDQSPTSVDVQEDAQHLRIEGSDWSLDIKKHPWDLVLTNKRTNLAWQLTNTSDGSSAIGWTSTSGKESALHLINIERVERNGNHWRMEVEVAGSATPAILEIAVLSPAIIRLSIRAPQSAKDSQCLQLHFKGTGPFFGSGERFDRVKLDGWKTVLRPEDLLGKPGHNWTYIPVPFLFTPRGLGIYLDTAAVSTLDVGKSEKEGFSFQIDDRSVDAYLFVGEPKQILSGYTSLTGHSPVLPPWAFGVWVCAYRGPDKVIEDARRLRQEKIPASAIWTFDVMDKGDIMGWPLWWTGYYPQPRQLTDQIHSLGFKALTYVHPYIRSVLDPYNLPSPSFEEGKQSGLFVLDAQGQPAGPAFEPFKDGNIDFTRPSNVDWWERRIREILLNDNFDGWMEDYGEWVNDTDRFAANISGRTMANLNPLFYHRITYEIAREAKPDVVEFVRSGYAGSQGYTRVVWGGDQFPNWSQDYGLPSVLRAGITAGLSGFGIWGPDIVANGHSQELWTRWVEFGALTPIMRDHPWDKPEGAVNLWHDPDSLDIFRRYARLHISLFPYFDTYAHEAARSGLPMMRHLMLESPSDINTYDVNDEYLLGDRMLVAPVVEEGALNRSLYLPQGSWTDYFTGQVQEGGRRITVPAPLQGIPLFVRSGSILPMISPDTETLAQDMAGDKYQTLGNEIIWRVFSTSAPALSTFTLADGTLAKATEDQSQIDIRVEHSGKGRRYEVILPATRQPQLVLLGRERLPEIQVDEHTAGWQFNKDDQTLHIASLSGDFDLHVTR